MFGLWFFAVAAAVSVSSAELEHTLVLLVVGLELLLRKEPLLSHQVLTQHPGLHDTEGRVRV
jgi:hypothetical protein